MPTRLLLVRHADSWHKQQGITGGPLSCRGLTDLGRQQAAHLRDRLLHSNPPFAPHHIYASVVPRAVETARILGNGFGIDESKIHQDCGLCSWHIPAEHDGMTWKEFEQFAVVGGGVFRPFQSVSESWAELVARTGRGLWGIAQRHRGETTLIVAHRETVVASLMIFGSLPLRPAFDIGVANTSLTEWSTDGNTTEWPSARWTLERLNDSAHLDEIAG